LDKQLILIEKYIQTLINHHSKSIKNLNSEIRKIQEKIKNEDLVKKVKAFVRGGVDIIIDPVGAELMEQSLSATAQGAQILSIGFAAGRPPRLPQNIMLVKNLTLHGFYFGRYIGWTPNDERLSYEPQMRRMMETLQRLTLDKKIFPTVSHVYEMETLPQALTDLHSRQVLNKLAIKISGDNHDKYKKI
jgi:NADPH2:quinone reductase